MDIPEDVQFEIQSCADQNCFDKVCAKHSLVEEQIKILQKSVNYASGKNPRVTPKRLLKSENPNFYAHYLNHLESEMGFETMQAVDTTVGIAWDRLNNRRTDTNTNYGLVVGRIQSGKTAHMIGLAVRALQGDENVDGYDTIIILAGTIEDLRKQTLERFNDIGYDENHISALPKNKDLTNEKGAKLNIINHFKKQDKRKKLVIVIKKNVDVINALNKCLQGIHGARMKNRKVMIIDDECDYASMDGNNAEDTDDAPNPEEITKTNKSIRKMIILLRETSSPTWYIGYTATPYANILMQEDSSTEDSDFGLSLYPRNFIYSLPKPSGHMDNEQYFIEKNQNIVLLDSPHWGDKQPNILHLILLHVLCKEIKKYRGIGESPHITLIHTAQKTKEHKKVAKEINSNIKSLLGREISSTLKLMNRCLETYYPTLIKSQRKIVMENISNYNESQFLRMLDKTS